MPTGSIALDSPSASAKFGAPVTVGGRLLDSSGAPVAGASIDVSTLVALAGAAAAHTTTLTTDAAGRFSYQPETRSTRTLTFSTSAAGGASASFALRVQAKVQLHASTRRLRHGRTLTLSGKVLVQPLLKKGPRVEIEVKRGQHWQTAGLVRAAQSGAFSWKRKLSTVTKYTFRARVLGTNELPADPAASRSLTVRII